jgi:hypothetical protein
MDCWLAGQSLGHFIGDELDNAVDGGTRLDRRFLISSFRFTWVSMSLHGSFLRMKKPRQNAGVGLLLMPAQHYQSSGSG